MCVEPAKDERRSQQKILVSLRESTSERISSSSLSLSYEIDLREDQLLPCSSLVDTTSFDESEIAHFLSLQWASCFSYSF